MLFDFQRRNLHIHFETGQFDIFRQGYPVNGNVFRWRGPLRRFRFDRCFINTEFRHINPGFIRCRCGLVCVFFRGQHGVGLSHQGGHVGADQAQVFRLHSFQIRCLHHLLGFDFINQLRLRRFCSDFLNLRNRLGFRQGNRCRQFRSNREGLGRQVGRHRRAQGLRQEVAFGDDTCGQIRQRCQAWCRLIEFDQNLAQGQYGITQSCKTSRTGHARICGHALEIIFQG